MRHYGLPSRLRSAGAMLFMAMALGCGEDAPTSPSGTFPELGKASTGPVVSAADPAAAPRDTTLDVHVLGSGFDNGSQAVFLLDGLPVAGVKTNRTTYQTSRELVANITIAATATPERYDIQVTSSTGKKGIGTEKFEVLDLVLLGSLGGSGGRAYGMNSAGQIVGVAGRADGTSAPFIWSGGVMRQLPLPPGWSGGGFADIDEAGVVSAGASDGTSWWAVRWLPSASGWNVELLPTLPGYEGGSRHTRAMNAAGDVVGIVTRTGLPPRVVIWHDGTPYRVNLSAPGLDPASVSVWDMSDLGWISGDARIGASHPAFIWRPDGSGVVGQGITVVLPSYGSNTNWGRAVNRSGVAVGYLEGKTSTALRWRPLRPDPSVTADYVVEVLPGSNALAWNIGDDGFIVGQQGGAPVSWTDAGSLKALPIMSNYRGEPNVVRVIEGRHWIGGDLVDAGSWQPSLWRVP